MEGINPQPNETQPRAEAAPTPSGSAKRILGVLVGLILVLVAVGKLVRDLQRDAELARLRDQQAKQRDPQLKIMSEVMIGMTVAEVEAIMGPATKKATRYGIDYLGWKDAQGFVQLIDGKVGVVFLSGEFPPLGWRHPPKGSREYAYQEELKSLKGAWTLVSQERNGKEELTEDPACILSFSLGRGEHWSLKKEADTLEGGVIHILDPVGNPKSVDLAKQKGEKWIKDLGLFMPVKVEEATYLAIYKIEDDMFHLCHNGGAGKERPKEFRTKEGDGLICSVWTRKKP